MNNAYSFLPLCCFNTLRCRKTLAELSILYNHIFSNLFQYSAIAVGDNRQRYNKLKFIITFNNSCKIIKYIPPPPPLILFIFSSANFDRSKTNYTSDCS